MALLPTLELARDTLHAEGMSVEAQHFARRHEVR